MISTEINITDKTPPFHIGQRLICLNKKNWLREIGTDNEHESIVPRENEEVTCGNIIMGKEGWEIFLFEYGLGPNDSFYIYNEKGELLFKENHKATDIYDIKEWVQIKKGLQFFVLENDKNKIIKVKRVIDGKEFILNQILRHCIFDPESYKKLKKRIEAVVSISYFFDDNINVEINYLFRTLKSINRIESTDGEILSIFLSEKVQINEVDHPFSCREYSFVREFVENNIHLINSQILLHENTCLHLNK